MGAGVSWEAVKRYDTTKISAFLVLHNMHEHCESFLQAKIDGKALLKLEKVGLVELGVTEEEELEMLRNMKEELYTLGPKTIRKIITPFPIPAPPPKYLGAATRDAVYSWDSEQVLAFLELNNLGGYKSRFKANKITGAILLQKFEQGLMSELGMEPVVDIPRLGAALDWNYIEPKSESESEDEGEEEENKKDRDEDDEDDADEAAGD